MFYNKGLFWILKLTKKINNYLQGCNGHENWDTDILILNIGYGFGYYIHHKDFLYNFDDPVIEWRTRETLVCLYQ